MCIVSAVLNHGQQIWPGDYSIWPNAGGSYPLVAQLPTQEQWDEFCELAEKARRFDELAAQPDCEDPEKMQWFHGITRLLRKASEALDVAADKLAGDVG